MSLHPGAISPPNEHVYITRVYYEDTDAGGVAYHASYLRFAERARTEALRALGAAHAEMYALHGAVFVVRRLEIRYLRPARLDDEVSVITGLVRLGGATADLRQRFRSAGCDLAGMDVQLACVRQADGRPTRIPERWREALARWAGNLEDITRESS